MKLPRRRDPDDSQRHSTARAVAAHRSSLQRVRETLRMADETLADEIRRLDRAARGEGLGI